LPEGWRAGKFSKCIIKKSVNKSKIPQTLYLKKGKYPIVDQGSNIIAGYTNNESLVYKHDTPVIVFGDHTRIFKYVDFNFAIGADGTKIIHPNLNIVNPKYFYFVLRNSDLPNDGYNRHYKYLNSIEIPLPPTIDDQIAIANELERKMAEVDKMRRAALRQKEAIAAMQGAILREVFPYKEGDKLPNGWQWMKVRKIMEDNVQVFSPENYGTEKFVYIDISSVDNVSKKIVKSNQIFVKDAPSRAKYILKENDIIISTVRPNLNAVALANRKHDGNVCSNGFCVIRLKCGSYAPYFFYYFTSPYFVGKVSRMVQGAMYPAINDDDVKNFSIPLPPTLDNQIVIANKLERKMTEVNKIRQAIDRQLEAIEALPGAILREVFDFEEK